MDRWLITASNEFEADAVLGLLATVGIRGRAAGGGNPLSPGVGPPYDIYVLEGDLQRAREVIHGAGDSGASRQTEPRGIDPMTGQPYEPVSNPVPIPVPKRGLFDRLLHRADKVPPTNG